MIVNNELEQNQKTLQTEEPPLMVAENKNFEENKDNVLFEPRGASDINDISTTMDIERDYDTQIDPSVMVVNKIRCCMCGVLMVPNGCNTCISCMKSQVDITEGISKMLQLQHCKECNRYLGPPWRHYEPESAPLLAMCLKHVKGLKRVKMIDAIFVWTEAHSKRLKIKITIQKEVLSGTMLQQTLMVEFIICNLQCDSCKKTYTPHLWQSQVQVRQKVDHKRTFLFLEQLILKHNAIEKIVNIQKEDHGQGLNFHFNHRSHAQRFTNFIEDNVLCKEKHTKQLISHDEQNQTYNYKYTFIVDLAPVCRDDLVILPKNVSRKYGGIGPMVLITKISQAIHIVDIKTMQTHEIDKATYWQTQFFNCLGRERLSEFIVMNIENIDNDNNTSKSALRQKLRQVQVEVARKEDFGVNDKTYIINSHLGEILNFNDTVLGYDLVQANISDIDEYNHVDKYLPEIVLVKKTFPKFRKRQRNRIWKLKHFEDKKMEVKTVVEEEEEDDDGEDARNNKPKEKKKTKKQLRRELKEDKDVKKGKDYEHFLQDIEDDPELRSHVNLYKDDDIIG